MFTIKGRVHIYTPGASNPYRPYAQSDEYALTLDVPDEQIAGAEIMKRWRADGSRATGGEFDPSIAYTAQVHLSPAEEDEEQPTVG